MSDSQWLNGLKAGDRVVISSHGLTLATVTHATATQVHVNGSKFRRATGRLISSDNWSSSYIVEPTTERRTEIKRDHAAARLRNIHWRELPDGVLFAAYDLIRQHLLESGAKELDVQP